MEDVNRLKVVLIERKKIKIGKITIFHSRKMWIVPPTYSS